MVDNRITKGSSDPSGAQNGHACDFISRNLRIGGRRTSIRLERAMWDALEDIARNEDRQLRDLCATIDMRRRGSNLTAAVRLFIISYFRLAVAERRLPQLDVPQNRHLTAGMAEQRFSQLMQQALDTLE